MSKYGLNLRPAKQKKQPPRPALATPFGFNDDDENDVEREIALQASKNKTLKEVEEHQKKSLEEDPSIFDYDGVYDKMKEKVARPLIQDREERKVKVFVLKRHSLTMVSGWKEVEYNSKQRCTMNNDGNVPAKILQHSSQAHSYERVSNAKMYVYLKSYTSLYL